MGAVSVAVSRFERKMFSMERSLGCVVCNALL